MTNTNNAPHAFSHLGQAPYTFLGVSERVHEACPGATVKGAGSCDHCGQGIRYVARFRAACGAEFGTGLDCAQRAYGDESTMRDRLAAHQARIKAAAAARRDTETIAAGIAALREVAVRRELRGIPHSKAFMARQGHTALDEVVWLLRHAGRTGRAKAARRIVKTARRVRAS